jgi:hypothetical protein
MRSGNGNRKGWANQKLAASQLHRGWNRHEIRGLLHLCLTEETENYAQRNRNQNSPHHSLSGYLSV